MTRFAILCVAIVLALVVLCGSVKAEQQSVDYVDATLVENVESAVHEPAADTELIEIASRPLPRTGRGSRGTKRTKTKHGWAISPRAPRQVQQRLPKPRLTGAASSLTRTNVRCVLCQFIVEKVKNGLTGDASSDAKSSAAADPTVAASLIETFAFASAADQARIQSTVAADAAHAATVDAIPALFDHGKVGMRRFRHTDILASRANDARFTQQRANQPGAETDAHRAAYLQLYSTVYASFETLCAKRMPLAYLPYCNDMLKSYRFFAQGINYGDRPESICMNGNFCASNSYVRLEPHIDYTRQPGDA